MRRSRLPFRSHSAMSTALMAPERAEPRKGTHAIHVLPVVLDARWIFTDEVFAHFFDDRVCGVQIGPTGGFSYAIGAIVGPDSHDVMETG